MMKILGIGVVALAVASISCVTDPSERLVLGKYMDDPIHLTENPSFELVDPLELRVRVETSGTDCATGKETTRRAGEDFAEVLPLHWEPGDCSNRGRRIYLHEASIELPSPGAAFEVRVLTLDPPSRDTLVFRWTR